MGKSFEWRSGVRALAATLLCMGMALTAAPAAAAPTGLVYLNTGPVTPQSDSVAATASQLVLPTSTHFSILLTITQLGTVSDWSNVFAKASTQSDSGGLSLSIAPNSSTLFWDLGGRLFSSQLNVGVAKNLAITHSPGGQLSIYENGVISTQVTDSTFAFLSTGALYLSSPWYAAANVSVSNFAIFNRALSASEVSAPLVPEPATLALFGLALAGALASVSRRRVRPLSTP